MDKDDYEKGLTELYNFVSGKTWPYSQGITTYPDRQDTGQKELHEALLELERRGKVRRHLEEGDFIIWMPKINQ